MPIAVPQPELTPDGMVQRARDLIPVLRARQADCEAQGRLPVETNRDFVQAGFYRVLQPRVFGGYEFGLPTFMRVMVEVARGCGSSGWVLALTAGHAHTLSAFYPLEAQEDIYGADGEYRGPSSLGRMSASTAEPVPGGYRVTGGWDYVSGIDIATHLILGAQTPDGTPLMLVLDAADVRVIDNWDPLGLRGTGSRRGTAQAVFVPAERAIRPPRDEVGSRTAPGRGVHANPIYRTGRMGSVLLGEMAAVAVGLAWGAMDAYQDELTVKQLAYPPFNERGAQPEYQRHFGEARALIEMAEATLLRVAEDYEAYAADEVERGVPFSDARDARLQMLEQYITRLCGEAVDLMFRTSGTSASKRGSFMERAFRDMSVLRTHFAAQYHRGAETFGRLYLTALQQARAAEAPLPELRPGLRVGEPVTP